MAPARPTPAGSVIWAFVLDVDRFVRLHFLFFSCLWVILGAVSVTRNLSVVHLCGLVLVAVCFHVYAFVLNDVIDLPVDRTQPRRQRDPLVRGALSRVQALGVALLQPMLMVPLTLWLGGGLVELGVAALGLVAMGAYNLWGKRCPVPPLTDFIQGVAWGSLSVYAAGIEGDVLNATAWIVATYAVGYTLFMNGVHGGLRDLANDLGRGARTTAIFLGARPGRPGVEPYVPATVILFTSTTVALLLACSVLLLARNDFGYGPVAWSTTALLVAILSLTAVLLTPRVMRPGGLAWEMAFRLQMYLMLMSLPAAFLAAANVTTLAVLALLKVISLAVLDSAPAIARWTLGMLRSRVQRPFGPPVEPDMLDQQMPSEEL